MDVCLKKRMQPNPNEHGSNFIIWLRAQNLEDSKIMIVIYINYHQVQHLPRETNDSRYLFRACGGLILLISKFFCPRDWIVR